MRTRDRIAKAALALFNERGEGQVSLAQIAGKLHISEGNLWYHFRTKRDLVAALFLELEERIERNLSRELASDGKQLADFAEFARQSFRDIWEYRFLYRHRCDIEEESALALRIADLIERSHRHTERILAAMVARKLLRASAPEITELAVNAWIISRHWLDYLQERHGLARISEADLQGGVRQIFALFRPYLTDAARAQIGAEDVAPKKKVARG
ncbi:MAG TPA: TetR/AcrR family transcriptional regulator [Stellaceae bacterium]|nr:TetR/AcrR family transcriptional regulator [Stellaceae bacterium]